LKFRRTKTNDNAELAENVCHIAANVLRTPEEPKLMNGMLYWKRIYQK
jgi:hypothetical protein